MLSILDFIYQRLRLTFLVNELEIQDSGNDTDGDFFITLKNGKKFFGPKSRTKDKKFYRLLSRKTKEKLIFEAFGIAIDIIIRYQEGSLKLGGPAKELYYKASIGDVVAEMGAYQGFYTMYLSENVGSEGKIIAIEPIEQNLRFLRKNISSNRIENVEIIPFGVWKENAKLQFERRENDMQSSSADLTYKNDSTSFEIEVKTLDTILKSSNVESIDFMLIQLNGAELNALLGLKNFKPKNFSIAARYNVSDSDMVKEIVTLLGERSYDVKVIEKNYIFAKLDNDLSLN